MPTAAAPAAQLPSTTGAATPAAGTIRKFQTSSGLNQARALRQLALATAFAARQESYTLIQQTSQYIGIVGINNVITTGSIQVPNTFKEAMASPHSVEWLTAAKKEHQSLIDLNVFHLLFPDDVPPRHNVISSRWVFKVKTDGLFKGRVVATEWSQRHDIDCGSTSRRSAVSRANGSYSLSLQLMDAAYPLWIFRLHFSCGKLRRLRPRTLRGDRSS